MRSRTSCPKRLDCSASTAVTLREFADVGAGDERLVAGAGQDDAAHRGIVTRVLEGRHAAPSMVGRIEGVEHLRPVDRHIGDRALLSRTARSARVSAAVAELMR